MKKISLPASCLLFFSLFLPVPGFPGGPGFHVEPVCTEKGVSLDIRVHDYPDGKIYESLGKGYRCEVIYNLKIYRKSEGVFSFLGDHLVTESNLAREAGWDIFERRFYFEGDSGETRFFEDGEDFLRALFHLENYHLQVNFDVHSSYYLLVGVRINPVKLAPPISIIRMIRPDGRSSTSLKRIPLNPAKGTGS